jgi:hypothetical protein
MHAPSHQSLFEASPQTTPNRAYRSGLPKVVLAFKSQDILATDSRLEHVLGYLEFELHGSNFRMFCGPRTDLASIGQAVENSSFFKTTVINNVLYDKSGCPQKLKVSFSPFYNQLNILVACLVEMETLESSERPTSTSDGYFSAHCHPTDCSAPHRPADPSHNAPGFFLSLPGHDGAGPAIFPRRKAGGGGCSGMPVIITQEVLKTLEGQPLTAAAQRLGVSPTAFKNACRKLGIRRWAYRKGGAAASAADGIVTADYIQRVQRKHARPKKPSEPAARCQPSPADATPQSDPPPPPPPPPPPAEAPPPATGFWERPTCAPAAAAAASLLDLSAPPPELSGDVHLIFESVLGRLDPGPHDEAGSGPAFFEWPRSP